MVGTPPNRSFAESVTLAPISRIGFAGAPLPIPLTELVGREREIAALAALVDRTEIRLLTLTGPGGVGKTRLALAVADAVEKRFAAGAALVSLAAVPDVALVPSTVAQSLGIRDAGDRPLVETLIQALQHQHLLLVLDNLEHLLPATPLISALLVSCPNLKILATSRAV